MFNMNQSSSDKVVNILSGDMRMLSSFWSMSFTFFSKRSVLAKIFCLSKVLLLTISHSSNCSVLISTMKFRISEMVTNCGGSTTAKCGILIAVVIVIFVNENYWNTFQRWESIFGLDKRFGCFHLRRTRHRILRPEWYRLVLTFPATRIRSQLTIAQNWDVPAEHTYS
jgi:hypothetical protein